MYTQKFSRCLYLAFSTRRVTRLNSISRGMKLSYLRSQSLQIITVSGSIASVVFVDEN